MIGRSVINSILKEFKGISEAIMHYANAFNSIVLNGTAMGAEGGFNVNRIIMRNSSGFCASTKAILHGECLP